MSEKKHIYRTGSFSIAKSGENSTVIDKMKALPRNDIIVQRLSYLLLHLVYNPKYTHDHYELAIYQCGQLSHYQHFFSQYHTGTSTATVAISLTSINSSTRSCR